MGYCEVACQLCGVSFALARIRRADEPTTAAWNYTGESYVDEEGGATTLDETCGDTSISGCYIQERPGETEPGLEHVAGPGCASGRGYSGYRITMEEMVGCRAMQCLVKKEEGWREQEGDEEWEREGGYFLTGVGDGSPDEAPLEGIKPVRHGVDSIFISNFVFENEDEGLPFHPTCFEIFKKVSLLRLGFIDVHGLWSWRACEGTYLNFFETFPRPFAVRNGHDQWWHHEPGHEYLAANPINIPMLRALLSQTRHSIPKTVLGANILPKDDLRIEPIDPFSKLSNELTSEILDYLGSREIVNLRLASGAFRCVPNFLFRRLVMEDMPWLYEARDLDKASTDWYFLYCKVEFCWLEFKGLKNRKRIWKDVEEIVRRIQYL